MQTEMRSKENYICWQECEETETTRHVQCECHSAPAVDNSTVTLQKIKRILPYNLSIFLQSKELKTGTERDMYTRL